MPTSLPQNPPLSPTSGAAPEQSRYYNRAFWAAYKGHSRGLLGGILLGTALGAAIGGIVGLGLLAGGWLAAATATTGVLTVVGIGAAVGSIYYKDVFSLVGAIAGSNSTVMEINDQRSALNGFKLDKLLELEMRKGAMTEPELDALKKDIALRETQQDQFYDKKLGVAAKPFVFGRVALIGALAGMVFGGATLAASHALLGSVIATTAPFWVAGAAIMAGATLAGATYGINRDLYRRVFNVTNPLYDGDLSPLDRSRQNEITGIAPELIAKPGLETVQSLRPTRGRPLPTYASDIVRPETDGLVPLNNISSAVHLAQMPVNAVAEDKSSFRTRLEAAALPVPEAAR